MMSELKELLEKVKLENIMAFMIYGPDSGRERQGSGSDGSVELKNPMMRFFIDWNIYTQKQIGKMINCLM